MIYLELFLTYSLIGLFTIGGGYAMLPLIKGQVVDVKGWIDLATFTDIVGISQMTPGPIGVNSATYIGYSVLQNAGAGEFGCILGSTIATFAVIWPSFAIVLCLCKAYDKMKDNTTFKDLMAWLRPVVVGLIASAAALLMNRDNFIDYKSFIIFAGAFLVMFLTKLSPILVLLLCGVAGIVLY